MRATSYDHADITKGLLVQITDSEAKKRIADNLSIIVRVRHREFLEAKTQNDLEQIEKLNSLGVFPMKVYLKEKERP